MERGKSKVKRPAVQPDDTVERRIREAGERARAEAETRRSAAEAQSRSEATREIAHEIGGRGGPEPARYGDWEVKGIASDF